MNPQDYLALWALVPGGLLALLLLFRRPQWIPPTILMAATATPWSFAKGITPVMAMLAVATAFTALATLFGLQRRFPTALGQRRVTLAFAGAAVVSAIVGWLGAEQEVVEVIRAEWVPVQLGQLGAIVMGPAALLLTARFLTGRRQLSWMVWTYVALTTAGMLIQLTIRVWEVNLRGLILTWSAALILGQLLFNPRLDSRKRVVLAAIFLLTLWVKIGLGFTWVSGWLPTLTACAVIAAFRWPKTVLASVLAATFLVLLAGDAVKDNYDREYAESGGTRLENWSRIARQPFVWNHALLGTGPANYAVYFAVYTPADRMSTHNNYLDIFLQLGFVGVALVLAILVMVGRLAFRLSRSQIDDPFLLGFARSATGGLVAVVVAMGLGDWFTPFVFNQGLAGFSWTVQSWIFFGALCAIPSLIGGRQVESRAFRFSRQSERRTASGFAEPAVIRRAVTPQQLG